MDNFPKSAGLGELASSVGKFLSRGSEALAPAGRVARDWGVPLGTSAYAGYQAHQNMGLDWPSAGLVGAAAGSLAQPKLIGKALRQPSMMEGMNVMAKPLAIHTGLLGSALAWPMFKNLQPVAQNIRDISDSALKATQSGADAAANAAEASKTFPEIAKNSLTASSGAADVGTLAKTINTKLTPKVDAQGQPLPTLGETAGDAAKQVSQLAGTLNTGLQRGGELLHQGGELAQKYWPYAVGVPAGIWAISKAMHMLKGKKRPIPSGGARNPAVRVTLKHPGDYGIRLNEPEAEPAAAAA